MGYKPRCLVTVLALLGMELGVAATTKADLIIYTPQGLVAGDTFRIAFVTDATTEATSTSISTYNTFVNNDAITEAGGGANVVTYDGTTLAFAAIASTASVNAISNIGKYGAPVYLSNGTMVTPSDTATGLWSSSLAHALDTDLLGATRSGSVWTGTQANGHSSQFPMGGGINPDGLYYETELGDPQDTNSNWVYIPQVSIITDEYAMYGISQVLTVPAAVPEPSSICLAMLGLGAAITCSTVCRERGQETITVKGFWVREKGS